MAYGSASQTQKGAEKRSKKVKKGLTLFALFGIVAIHTVNTNYIL